MITCPWCNTSYLSFQSNCTNCGGPLPLPQAPKPEAPGVGAAAPDLVELPEPPPAPRQFADSYIWKLLFVKPQNLIFSILAIVFVTTGGPLLLTGVGMACLGGILIVPLIIGVVFVIISLPMTVGGAWLGKRAYDDAKQTLHLLRHGEKALGEIVSVEPNHNVTVNGRHPYNIGYRFQVNGVPYEGVHSSLNTQAPRLRVGQAAYIIYLPEAPKYNLLYLP